MSYKNRKRVFIIFTLLTYAGLIALPSAKWSFIPFFIFFTGAYIFFESVTKALFISSVFAIPFDFGKSLLKVETDVSYFILSSFDGFTLLLAFLSLRKKINIRIKLSDMFLLLFFIWGVLSFAYINTYYSVLDGIFKLTFVTIFYFLARIYIKDKQIREVLIFIFISTVLFESTVTIVQFIRGYPLGRFIEKSTWYYPYGRVAAEKGTLFRAAGTFVEPTWLARFINILLPFIAIKLKVVIKSSGSIQAFIYILGITAIVATFTRVSIVISLLVLLIILIAKKTKWKFKKILFPVYIFLISFIIIISFIIYPFIKQRVGTSRESFDIGGSIAYRMTLVREAVNLIKLSPIWGVGLNQFEKRALEENATGFFEHFSTQVHNVPLLIASEMGIPAVFIFFSFVAFSYKRFLTSKLKKDKVKLYTISDAAALGGAIYLLESMVGTNFISPHFLLFILFMAIIA